MKTTFTPKIIKELKSFLVERYVDNMSEKDLVQYVMDDLDRYYDSMPDAEFLDEAENYWEDHFDEVVEEVKQTKAQGLLKSLFFRFTIYSFLPTYSIWQSQLGGRVDLKCTLRRRGRVEDDLECA